MADLLLQQLLRRFHLEHLLSTLLLALLCAVLSLSGLLGGASRYLYDRLAPLVSEPLDASALLVTIDDLSLAQVGRWPWDRAVHAQLIDQLHALGARAILYDLLLTDADTLRPQSDQLLAAALSSHGRVYLPVHLDEQRGGQAVEVLPWRGFAEQARLGHIDFNQDADGRVRTLWLRSGVGQAHWPQLAVALLEDESPQRVQQYRSRERGVSTAGYAPVYEHLRRVPLGELRIARLSAAEVLTGSVAAELLADRIVLVGSAHPALGDQHRLAGRTDPVSGVELHARVLTALQSGQLVADATPLPALITALLVALLAPLLLPMVAPRHAALVITALLVTALLVSLAGLRWYQVWWSPAPALLTIALAWPLWTWRRLEYSLDYLRRMTLRILRPGDQSALLVQPASLVPLQRMLGLLPVRAWRLENRSQGGMQRSGEEVEESAWQGQAARHYSFRRSAELLELSLLWRSGDDATRYAQTVQAMLDRVSAPAPLTSSALRPVADAVVSLGSAERRQRHLTRALHASLSALPEGILLADAVGEVVLANPALKSLLALDDRPLAAWHLADLGRDLGLDTGHWQSLLRDALREAHAETLLLGADGERLALTLSRIEPGGRVGQLLLLQLKDISEQDRARRTRDELLHFLSHDLRSPLISILALIEKARQGGGAPLSSDFLEQVELHARRNLGMAEQFLQLIRIEALDKIEMAPLDMLPVVESAEERCRSNARSRDVVLRFHYQSDEQVWVVGNHELLERLIFNLIDNAIRHSFAGGSVDVRLYCEAEAVCCEVRDRGPGIAVERQKALFDVSGKAPGRGFGLRFVELVARRHRGAVLLDSEPGEGSRFTLSLPALPLDEL